MLDALLTVLPLSTGPGSFDILQGHSRATMFLILNNAAQGILSSFFFKYAGKKKKDYLKFISLYIYLSRGLAVRLF